MEEAGDFKCVFVVYCVLESKEISSCMSARLWFDLLYNWPPNIELLLNNTMLELIYFFNKRLIR